MFLEDSPSRNSDGEFVLSQPSDCSVYELLADVCREDNRLLFKLVDEQKNLRPHIALFIGNENCRSLDGIKTLVNSGDEISVFPALSGG